MKGLPYEVKSLLAKARESALLAVETYNRPSAHFRSGAYVVLMNIAWTSLFHALFIRRRIRPFYRKPGSPRFQKVDGDYRRWELAECLRQHFGTQNPPLRKNLEFFIAIRNKIEHCTLAELDPEIYGECQAMLLNFEKTLCDQFGDRCAINGGLTYSLQFSATSSPGRRVSGQGFKAKSFRGIKQFIESYRSSLSADIQGNLEYSFKVFLVPKVGNHATKDTVAVEFVPYDPSKPEEMQQYERVVAMIKPKEVPVANLALMKPSEVVKRVGDKIGRPFKMHHHVTCYHHFNARPQRGAADAKACDTRYCIFDAAHKDYLYTHAWVDHLVKTLSEDATYDFLLDMKKSKTVAAPAAEGHA